VRLYDTLTAARVVGSRMSYSYALKDVVPRYLGTPLDKAERLSDWSQRPLTAEQLAYAARDVQVLLPLREQLDAAIARLDVGWVWELERRLAPCMIALEQHGMLIDAERWRATTEAVVAERDALTAQIRAVLGPDFALAKRAHWAAALAEQGIELPRT